MLDSQNYADANNVPSSNASDAPAFARNEEILVVTGAAWAEYHLLLGASSPHATRIEREIRTFGGAPTIAILLARWAAEEPATSHLAITLSLSLGRDPNARLLRRELELWATRLPNLRLAIKEDLNAPEVAYRILMWPQASASTWGAPQLLQCGEIRWNYEIEVHHSTNEITGHEASGDDVYQAARWWQLLKLRKDRKLGFDLAAQRCWARKSVLERIACDLTWAEVEAEVEAEAGTRASEKI